MTKHRYKDISGQKFGKLLIIEYAKTIDKRPYWKCKCDCGSIIEKRGKEIKCGLVKSCGCLIHEKSHNDITNQKFNYLTVINCIGKKTKRSDYWWHCKCDCGNYTQIPYSKIVSGNTKSCGCLIAKKSSERIIVLNKYMSGKNHPRWKIDLTDEDRRSRREKRESDPKLNRWRKKVYVRDRFTCVKCGDNKGGNLNGHHIYSWNSHLNLRYVTDNGVTLCKSCHQKFHRMYGLGNNTKKQWTLFICQSK